jgi:hypothetical protein
MIRKFARSSLKLNQTILKNGFCVNQAYLTPERHITMAHSVKYYFNFKNK